MKSAPKSNSVQHRVGDIFDEEIHLASEPADGLGSLTMGGNPERSETEVRIG